MTRVLFSVCCVYFFCVTATESQELYNTGPSDLAQTAARYIDQAIGGGLTDLSQPWGPWYGIQNSAGFFGFLDGSDTNCLGKLYGYENVYVVSCFDDALFWTRWNLVSTLYRTCNPSLLGSPECQDIMVCYNVSRIHTNLTLTPLLVNNVRYNWSFASFQGGLCGYPPVNARVPNNGSVVFATVSNSSIRINGDIQVSVNMLPVLVVQTQVGNPFPTVVSYSYNASFGVARCATGFEHWTHASNVEFFLGSVTLDCYNAPFVSFIPRSIQVRDIYTPSFAFDIDATSKPLIISACSKPSAQTAACQNGGEPNPLYDASTPFPNSDFVGFDTICPQGVPCRPYDGGSLSNPESPTQPYSAWYWTSTYEAQAQNPPCTIGQDVPITVSPYHYPYDAYNPAWGWINAPPSRVWLYVRIREGIALHLKDTVANNVFGQFFTHNRVLPSGHNTSNMVFADVVSSRFSSTQLCMCRNGYFGPRCQFDIANASFCGAGFPNGTASRARSSDGLFDSSKLCYGRGACPWSGYFTSYHTTYGVTTLVCSGPDYTGNCSLAALETTDVACRCNNNGYAPNNDSTMNLLYAGRNCEVTCDPPCNLASKHLQCVNRGTQIMPDMRCECQPGFAPRLTNDSRYAVPGDICWTCTDERGYDDPYCNSGRGICPLSTFATALYQNPSLNTPRTCVCNSGFAGYTCDAPLSMNLSCGNTPINVSCALQLPHTPGNDRFSYSCSASQVLTTLVPNNSESYNFFFSCGDVLLTDTQAGFTSVQVLSGTNACQAVLSQCQSRQLLTCPVPFRNVCFVSLPNAFCDPPGLDSRLYMVASYHSQKVYCWLSSVGPDTYTCQSSSDDFKLSFSCDGLILDRGVYLHSSETLFQKILALCT